MSGFGDYLRSKGYSGYSNNLSKQGYVIMKRQNPYVASTTKSQRFQKIANNPNSLAYKKNRQMVLYTQPRATVRTTSQELNYKDVAFSGNFDTTGSIQLINTIAQGASQQERIGKKCVLRNLTIRGFSYSNTNTLMSDCCYMIVYDENPTGALPAITDILTAAQPNSFMNPANSTRFRVLKRRDFVCIGSYSAPTTGMEAHNEDQFMRINREMVFKNVGTGAIGDIQKGALYVVTVGGAAPGNTAPVTNLAFRIRFTEQ